MMKSTTTTVALLVFSCILQFTEGSSPPPPPQCNGPCHSAHTTPWSTKCGYGYSHGCGDCAECNLPRSPRLASGMWKFGGSLKNYPGYGCLPVEGYEWFETDLTLKECQNACELKAGCRSIDWGSTGRTCGMSRSIGGGGDATGTSDCRHYELHPSSFTSSEVNDAVQAFCPDYATDVGVEGKPKYGGSAEMCRTRDEKYETRLHQAMFHGMFGGASGTGRDCEAWCLFDVEENRHFKWDHKKVCWKTKKNRPCTGSTNEEREFAADIFDTFSAADPLSPSPTAPPPPTPMPTPECNAACYAAWSTPWSTKCEDGYSHGCKDCPQCQE